MGGDCIGDGAKADHGITRRVRQQANAAAGAAQCRTSIAAVSAVAMPSNSVPEGSLNVGNQSDRVNLSGSLFVGRALMEGADKTEGKTARQATDDPLPPSPASSRSADQPLDFFQSYKMWIVYLAVLVIASFFVFEHIPIALWSIVGAIAFVLVVAFVYAVLKPKGPYESPSSLKSPGGSRGFFGSFKYYSDYLAPIAIACGFAVYFLDPDIGRTWGWGVVWGMVLALIATLFIVSAILAVKKPVAFNDPQPAVVPTDESQGFLRPFGRYLLYAVIWFGAVLLFDPDVTLTSGLLLATGAMALVLSLIFAVLKPQGPFQNSG